jgi:hypothetical protein
MLAGWPDADRHALSELLGRFTTEFENVKTRTTEPAPAHSGAAQARS